MTKEEFENIIRPLVLLPRDQSKLLKQTLLKNFEKWQKEAINYIDFEGWKKRHLIDRNHFNNTFLHDTEGWIEEHRLIYKYNSEVMNL